MRKIGKIELEDIAIGAAFLGSGGGGGKELGQILIDSILKITNSIKLITLDEVDDEEWGAVAAGIGAPDAASGITSFDSPSTAFRLLSEIRQRQFAFVLPPETGENTLVAALTAAMINIALVDGDGSGRSVPTLETTTYAAAGIPIAPTILASEKAPQVKTALYTKTVSEMEQLVRQILNAEEFGQMAGLATWAANGQMLREKQALLPGTVTFAQQVGATLRQARESKGEAVKALLEFLYKKECPAFELFQGAIAEVSEQTQGGFDFGSVTLDNGQEKVYILNQNENLIAWRSDQPQPLAMAPDLICLLTLEGEPLTNADKLKEKKGVEVVLIGMKAPDRLREAPILDNFLAILKNFGYYGPYIPLEGLYN